MKSHTVPDVIRAAFSSSSRFCGTAIFVPRIESKSDSLRVVRLEGHLDCRREVDRHDRLIVLLSLGFGIGLLKPRPGSPYRKMKAEKGPRYSRPSRTSC